MKTIKLITVIAAGFLVAGFNLLAEDAGKETTITEAWSAGNACYMKPNPARTSSRS